MIHYFFSFNREKQLIWIEAVFKNVKKDSTTLHIPAWRPGRYQLQNFARNMVSFEAGNSDHPLKWQKTSANTWEINTAGIKELHVKYAYYANEFNAGGSVINSSLIYVNPVNLCLFREEDIDARIKVSLKSDIALQWVCGISFTQDETGLYFEAHGYYELFDSPFMGAKDLFHIPFSVKNIDFHLWVYGHFSLDMDIFVKKIKRAAEYQINLFGDFPEKNYHFMLLIPPHSYYHGVEHRNSTVMVLSDNGILTQESEFDLLGLSSHELFHTWNIAKLRPKELLPYDYTKESFFETCFVAEGYTTYFGDKTLLDSGAFTPEEYRLELETLLKRHFDHCDNAFQSLLESSFDLWVDGYEGGAPNKKVSVYHKGAIASLILDSMIREKFDNGKSLENVMNILYERYGDLKKGYTYSDIVQICEEVYEGNLSDYFEKIIAGNSPVFEPTKKALEFFGLSLERHKNSIRLSRINKE